jgi:hypothetical protein
MSPELLSAFNPGEKFEVGHTILVANISTALVPANVPEYLAVTPGQVLNFISTSASTGYASLSEMS